MFQVVRIMIMGDDSYIVSFEVSSTINQSSYVSASTTATMKTLGAYMPANVYISLLMYTLADFVC